LKTSQPVEVVVGGKTYAGELRNLSVGGALVQLDRPLEAFIKAELGVPTVGRIKAVVIQGHPPASFQFNNLDAATREAIEAHLDGLAQGGAAED